MKFHIKIFLVLLALAPTQLAYHFWPSWALVYGIRVDYLAPTIYFADFLIVLMFVFWFAEEKKSLSLKKISLIQKPFLILGIFAFVNLAFSISWQVTLYKWIIFLKFALVFVYTYFNWHRLRKIIYLPIAAFLLLTLFISLGQLYFQKSIGGVFYYFGERTFSTQTPSIALADFLGKEALRPYATFSHPNSLAGFVLVALGLGLLSANKRNMKLAFILISSVLILISFSKNAFLALIIVFGLYRFRAFLNMARLLPLFVSVILLISFFMPLISHKLLALEKDFPESIQKRLELSIASMKIFLKEPFFGVGLGNFVVELPFQQEGYRDLISSKTAWWFQPVHNIYLLLLAETGIVGLILFLFFSYKLLKKANLLKNKIYSMILISIFLTGFLDHYWLTLHQNQLILSIVLAAIFSEKTANIKKD